MIESKYFKLVIDEEFKADWYKFVQIVALDNRMKRYNTTKDGKRVLDKRGRLSYAIRAMIRGYIQDFMETLKAQQSTHNDQSSNISKS